VGPLEALAMYVRAAAKRTGESIPFIYGRIASGYDVQLAAPHGGQRLASVFLSSLAS
jgi:hypothetical protein